MQIPPPSYCLSKSYADAPQRPSPLTKEQHEHVQATERRRLASLKYEGPVGRNIPILDFVRFVWGIDLSMIRTIVDDDPNLPVPLDEHIILPQVLLNQYLTTAFDARDASSDIALLFLYIQQQLDLDPEALPSYFINHAREQDHNPREFPRVIYGPEASHDWRVAGAFVHVGSKEQVDLGVDNDLIVRVGVATEVRHSVWSPTSDTHVEHVGGLCRGQVVHLYVQARRSLVVRR